MAKRCFAYGSLMCDDIMAAVCGLPVASLNALPSHLRDFARHPVAGETYPGIVPLAGAKVAGVLYLNVLAVAWRRLDRFEGEMYQRLAVPVELDDGTVLTADTYVFRAEFANRLAPGEWDFAEFLREGKARFTARYLGFERL